MAISKRLRFEVLRRDKHKCVYCGKQAIEAELQIDHVIPVSLGGTDIPENLATSCVECNIGKSSTSPEHATVAAVETKQASSVRSDWEIIEHAKYRQKLLDEYELAVMNSWNQYLGEWAVEKMGWNIGAVASWYSTGYPIEVIDHAIRITADNKSIPLRSKWAYTSGVLRNMLSEASSELSQITESEIYRMGYEEGYAHAQAAIAFGGESSDG